MTINNELSSDIAVAIIAQKKPTQELEQLKEIILSVHSVLQKMSQEISKTEKQSGQQKANHQPIRHPTKASSA